MKYILFFLLLTGCTSGNYSQKINHIGEPNICNKCLNGEYTRCKCCPIQCCSKEQDRCCCIHVDKCTCKDPTNISLQEITKRINSK